METANLIIRVVGEGLDEASRRLDELRARSRRAREETDVLSSSVRQLRQAALGLVGGLGIQSIIQTADTMKNLDSQVRLVTKSVEQFNAVQGRLREIANDQYSSIESLTELYTSSQRALSQLGKTQNETLQFTNNLAMAMRVGGGEAQAQAAALTQLGQALASGVLRGDEFNSIAEQAPILLRLISEELGVTQGELRKLAADGKISAEVVYNAVANSTEALEEMAAQMPVTVGQALTVLRNNFKTFIGDTLNSTVGWTGAIASAIGVVAKHFDSIATILIGGAVLWGAYALAVSSVIPAVLALTAAMLLNPVFMLAAVLTASVIATKGLEGAIDSLADAFAVMGLLALEAIGWIKSGISGLWKATNDYIGGLIENSATGAQESSGAFAWMFERTEGGFVGMLQVAANVFDRLATIVLAVALTIDKAIQDAMQNAGIAVQRVAAGMGNALVGAFNWAAQKVTEILNSIGAEINDKIEALNQLPLVNITYRAKTDKKAWQAQGYQSPDYIPNTFAGNYQKASNYVDLNGLRGKVDDAIYRREYAQLREENSRSTDSLNEVGNAAAKMADELDKAGKKGKEGTKKIAKGAKDAKEKMSEAQKAALALDKSYLNAQQSLQRTFNLIGHDTNLAQWVYDLSDPMHDLFNLAEDSKDVLKGFAASIDISELSYDLGKSNKDLEHQIKLLDAKSDLERELMDIEKETADLLEKYEVFKNIPGFAHVYKEIEAEAKLNEQWKKNLATKEATVAINKELTQSTDDLNKQIALLGNDSPLNSFLYDLQNTEKYANAGAEALEKYEQALRSLEKAELAQKMREDMGGLRTELLGYKYNTTDSDKNDYELEDTLTRIRQARELGLNIGGQYDQLEQIARQRHADKLAEIDNAMYQNRAGLFASASKALLGENSRTYKLMFAIEKGYALQSAWLKHKKTILDAYADTPGSIWNKAAAAAKAAADTGVMAAAIAAVQAPIGQAHDGIMSVPKSGTWNLEKGERVLPAHTAKAMDKKLEQGGKVIIHNYSGEKAEAKQDMDGNTIVVIGKMVNGIVDQKLAKFKRQEQRQGGLFSGA